MENKNGLAEPGWYPGPDGVQRYWDGTTWLSIPAPESGRQGNSRRVRAWLVAGIASAVIVGLIIVGLMFKADRDRALAEESARAEEAASIAAAEEAASIEAAEEAERVREEEERAERRQEQERDARRDSVDEIEASIVTMAEEHAASGLIDGPILEAICSPIAGGSLDDLAEQTTVFDCFVITTEPDENGSQSGYNYNATMNWTTSQYTYGFGSP